MEYRWEIKTGDVMNAGTDADVYLSLTGTLAAMKEVEIADAGDSNNWEKGEINSGVLQTSDLGELISGNLRHNSWGGAPGWHVDWVRITNQEDGRIWTATVGQFDNGGNYPRLRFTKSDPGQYDQIQKQKALDEQARRDKDAADKREADRKREEQRTTETDRDWQREMDKQRADLDKELEKARLEAEIARKRAEIDKLRGGTGTVPTGTGTSGGTLRTFELFGTLNGAVVPLIRVLSNNGGRYSVVAGGDVLRADSPAEGYGLSGTPGKWSQVYPGVSPTAYGLDADKGVLGFDGARAWAIPASTLQQIFGANWRSIFV